MRSRTSIQIEQQNPVYCHPISPGWGAMLHLMLSACVLKLSLFLRNTIFRSLRSEPTFRCEREK